MSLVRRILNLFSRSKVDREIEAELKSHIEMRIDENLASGMTQPEILREFPYLTEEDIRACLAYAADRERKLEISNA